MSLEVGSAHVDGSSYQDACIMAVCRQDSGTLRPDSLVKGESAAPTRIVPASSRGGEPVRQEGELSTIVGLTSPTWVYAAESLAEARVMMEHWRRKYNEFRPHSVLGYRPTLPEAILAPGPT